MTDDSQAGFSTLSDLEEAASRKTDRSAWAYIQGGAGEEWTVRANREAFHRRTLRPRVLVDVENLEFGTTLLELRCLHRSTYLQLLLQASCIQMARLRQQEPQAKPTTSLSSIHFP